MSDAHGYSSDKTHRVQLLRVDLLILAVASFGYLLLVAVGYRFHYDFVCRDVLPEWVCQGLSLAVPRALVCAGLLGLLIMIRADIRALHARVSRPRLNAQWLAIFATGLTMTCVPLLAVLTGDGALLPLAWVVVFWLGGLAVAGTGLVGSLYRVRFLEISDLGPLLTIVSALIVGLLLPDIALKLQPLWKLDWLTDATFQSVIGLVSLFGQSIVTETESKMIQLDDFIILVGPQCSGIEGFALITSFMLFYIFMFRSQLHEL